MHGRCLDSSRRLALQIPNSPNPGNWSDHLIRMFAANRRPCPIPGYLAKINQLCVHNANYSGEDYIHQRIAQCEECLLNLG